MSAYIVSRDLLEQNIRQLKKQAGDTPIWAVIKGDGYGLGALPLAEAAAENGIEHFCVTQEREAAVLRENGFSDATILMLRQVATREEINRLLDLRVIFTVGSLDCARQLDAIAAERADIAEVHLKIDTGMGRYGFLPQQAQQLETVYRDCKHLAVTGIYTHFNCAFGDEALTRQAFSAFLGVVDGLHAAGFETGTVHCCNSAAFLRFPEMHCDAVRLGSALLGRMPFRTRLRPVGYVETQVEEVRTLPVGATVGYGALWRAKRETRVAVLPVGWYHGMNVACKPDMSRARDCLRAALSALKGLVRRPTTTVEIGGRPCRVIGAIGMLHCTVDVTGLDCAVGERAVIQLNPLHRKDIPVVFR